MNLFSVWFQVAQCTESLTIFSESQIYFLSRSLPYFASWNYYRTQVGLQYFFLCSLNTTFFLCSVLYVQYAYKQVKIILTLTSTTASASQSNEWLFYITRTLLSQYGANLILNLASRGLCWKENSVNLNFTLLCTVQYQVAVYIYL